MRRREEKHTFLFMSSSTTWRPWHSAHVRFDGNGLGFSMKFLDCKNSQLLMLMYGCAFCLFHLPFDVGSFFTRTQSKHVRLDLPLFAVIASHRIVRDTFTFGSTFNSPWISECICHNADIQWIVYLWTFSYGWCAPFLCADSYSDYHTLGFLKKIICDVAVFVQFKDINTLLNEYSFGVSISALIFFFSYFQFHLTIKNSGVIDSSNESSSVAVTVKITLCK